MFVELSLDHQVIDRTIVRCVKGSVKPIVDRAGLNVGHDVTNNTLLHRPAASSKAC
jgi:hypothetical protein